MLIVELNFEVSEEINFKVAGWLPGFLEKASEFEGFKAVQWFFRQPEDEGRDAKCGLTLWTIHFFVEDRRNVDAYLKKHYAQAKQELIEKYGDKLSQSVRVLNLLSMANFPLGSEDEAVSQ